MNLFALSAIALGAGLVLAGTSAHALSRTSGAGIDGLGAPIIHVAHAGAPYTNVDHKNDAGNDTGDSQVDKLNDEQLQKARSQK